MAPAATALNIHALTWWLFNETKQNESQPSVNPAFLSQEPVGGQGPHCRRFGGTWPQGKGALCIQPAVREGPPGGQVSVSPQGTRGDLQDTAVLQLKDRATGRGRRRQGGQPRKVEGPLIC